VITKACQTSAKDYAPALDCLDASTREIFPGMSLSEVSFQVGCSSSLHIHIHVMFDIYRDNARQKTFGSLPGKWIAVNALNICTFLIDCSRMIHVIPISDLPAENHTERTL
jgi:hypothetical protein